MLSEMEVLRMVEKISRTVQKILLGVSSLRLYKTRDRKRYALNRKFLTAEERWREIGTRLRESTYKVVEHLERGD